MELTNQLCRQGWVIGRQKSPVGLGYLLCWQGNLLYASGSRRRDSAQAPEADVVSGDQPLFMGRERAATATAPHPSLDKRTGHSNIDRG